MTITLTERIAEAETVIVGRRVSGIPPVTNADGDETNSGSTRYEVVKILRDQQKELRVGSVVESWWDTEKNGDLVLVIAELWHVPITEFELKYLIEAPALNKPVVERLRYFIRFLEHSSPLIAEDAFRECNAADHKELASLVSLFPRDKLPDWCTGSHHAGYRRNLYGRLLGLSGNEQDALRLEKEILISSDEVRPGIEGVMTGYLLIRKEAGLAILEQKFRNAAAERYEICSGFSAIKFLADNDPDRIPRERLKAALRILLKRRDMAFHVVWQFADWKDWTDMDEIASHSTHNKDSHTTLINGAVARYLVAAIKDRPKDPRAPLPAHVIAAQKHLDALRLRDPELVEDAEIREAASRRRN